MIQIGSVIFTLILVGLVLYRNKEEFTVKNLTITAIFLSLALVMTMFAINIMVFGGQVVIRFSQLSLIVLAASLGPVYGLMGSIGFDVANLMLNPLGSFYFGFTLSNIMVSMIPAFIFKWRKDKNEKKNLSLLIIVSLAYLSYIIIVLSLAFINIDINDMDARSLMFNALGFVIIFSIIFLVSSLIMKRRKISLNNDLIVFVTSAILVEFIVQGFLTPLWLYDVARTPIIISMQIRALKGIIMVIVNTFVGFPIYKIVQDRIIGR